MDDSFQGMAGLLSEVSLANEMCQPCPRTSVNDVSGLNKSRGEGKLRLSRAMKFVVVFPLCTPPGEPAGAPGGLEVVAADRSIEIENLSGQE
jgi:hypothetical protein